MILLCIVFRKECNSDYLLDLGLGKFRSLVGGVHYYYYYRTTLLLGRRSMMKRIHGMLSFFIITVAAELVIVLALSDDTATDCPAINNHAPQSSVSPAADEEVYDILNVRPPSKKLQNSKIFSRFKRFIWKMHGRLIPFLHFGSNSPSETCVNLRVLWCKALSSVDPKSPVYERPHFWTYNFLPKYSRWILWITPSCLFPRWFHANIELRTAFLKRAIDKVIIAQLQQQQLIRSDKTSNKKNLKKQY